jgi:hypothetical protein
VRRALPAAASGGASWRGAYWNATGTPAGHRHLASCCYGSIGALDSTRDKQAFQRISATNLPLAIPRSFTASTVKT